MQKWPRHWAGSSTGQVLDQYVVEVIGFGHLGRVPSLGKLDKLRPRDRLGGRPAEFSIMAQFGLNRGRAPYPSRSR